jgi:cytoskeletal protein RodZ
MNTGAGRQSVGAVLGAARRAAGLELDVIARDTRVPLRHLRALEEDDHSALPALPYALGFIKSYARAVGLDAESVAQQFRSETQITPHVPVVKDEPMDERRLPSRTLVWGSAALIIAILVGMGLYGAGAFDPPAEAPAATVAEAEPQAPAAQAPPAAAPAAAAAPLPTAGQVVLTASEDVWIKIYNRATGKRAFQGLLAAGQRYEVPADSPPLTLRAGKAGAVQLSVGGRALPSLGGMAQTIDGVVLTAPALAERFGQAPPPPVVKPVVPAVQVPDMPAATQAQPN